MSPTNVSVVGNVSRAPELRFTPSGLALATFGAAVNNRKKDGDKWVDGDPEFYDVTCWRELAENVAEEHGHGDPARSHKHTFEGFLRALGADPALLHAPCPIAVHAFNRSLLDHCLVERHEVGAVLLGIIEYLYVAISHAIAQTIDERRWVGDGAQGHYRLHEALDPVHARDLFALARPAWESRWLRADLAQALVLGAHHFWRLYDELHRVE